MANALALAAERLVEPAGEIVINSPRLRCWQPISWNGWKIRDPGNRRRVDVLVDTIAGALQATALPLLISSLPYQAVPQNLRQAVKQAMKQSIAGMLHTPVAAPLQAALSALEQATDDLTEALLVLDPDTGLESGLRSVLWTGFRRRSRKTPCRCRSPSISPDRNRSVLGSLSAIPHRPLGGEKEISQSVQFDLGNVELSQCDLRLCRSAAVLR